MVVCRGLDLSRDLHPRDGRNEFGSPLACVGELLHHLIADVPGEDHDEVRTDRLAHARPQRIDPAAAGLPVNNRASKI